MARCKVETTFINRERVIVEKVESPAEVTLVMTPDEAVTLREVCRHIGGDGDRRKRMCSIGMALSSAGVYAIGGYVSGSLTMN